MKQNSLYEHGATIVKGFCMGTADVIPGVSGGTIAFILGIYPKLLTAIKSFDVEWLWRLVRLDIKGAITYPHFGFLIPLCVGIIAALLFFTRIAPLPVYIRTHPEVTYGLFFGLILGSIIILLRQLGELNRNEYLELAAGIVLGLLLVNLVPFNTPNSAWFIFISGAIATCAMILPGISGSFILLIFRKYAYVFDGLSKLDFTVMVPFILGAITGLALFSRILTSLLNTYYRPTLLVITGILVASLWVIWPFQDRVYEFIRGEEHLISTVPLVPQSLDGTTVVSLLLVGLGFVFILFIDWLARKRISQVA
ncbi:MAG: DUF368 domain-containing protein [Gammaproteobacteria bacterium]